MDKTAKRGRQGPSSSDVDRTDYGQRRWGVADAMGFGLEETDLVGLCASRGGFGSATCICGACVNARVRRQTR